MNRLVVCATCHDANSVDETVASLQRDIANSELKDQFSVESVDCMGACEAPISLAIQGKKRASYLFSGLKFLDDNRDIIATCKHYLASKGGWIEDAIPCGRLRHCLKARIPAFKD